MSYNLESEHDQYDRACGDNGAPIPESRILTQQVENDGRWRNAVLKFLGAVFLILSGGCTQLEPDKADPTHFATWTSPIDCGTKVAHPCPYMTFTTLATFYTTTTGALAITWWDAGTVDLGPDQELTSLDPDGNILLPMRGDTAGERLPATLQVSPDGYVGDVPWFLYNVAGMTAFHLEIAEVIAP